MANYHPSHELLMQFAAGQTSNAMGLIIACHLEKCAHCRSQVQVYEQLGGEIMDELEPQPVSEGLLDSIMAQLDTIEAANEHVIEMPDAVANLPRPLQRFVKTGFDELPWSGFTKSIQEYNLPISDDTFAAKLYKISAGKELPEHTHQGNEFTLVMRGGFRDKAGTYNPGDFIHTDPMVIHQPKALADEDCICFAVMDAPLKMTGFFGRLLNPFMR